VEIKTIQPFLHYFGNVRERTMRVARCIPPDKIDWTYAPGKFTLGDLLRHLAVAEGFRSGFRLTSSSRLRSGFRRCRWWRYKALT
jgi:hypothetical protein